MTKILIEIRNVKGTLVVRDPGGYLLYLIDLAVRINRKYTADNKRNILQHICNRNLGNLPKTFPNPSAEYLNIS